MIDNTPWGRVICFPFLCIMTILFLFCISPGCIDPGQEQRSQLQGATDNVSVRVSDAYGNSIDLSHPVQRIICQNAQTAELFADIGAGNAIVGLAAEAMTDQYRYLLNHTPNAISIGTCMTPDIETIIALHPDTLIFYGYKKPTNVDKLLATNVTLLYTKSYQLEALPDEARMLVKLTGKEMEAERYARWTEHYTSLAKTRLENISESERPRVYIESWTDYTAHARDSSMHDVITFLHAKNIAENLPASGTVSPEWVLEQDPDVIFKIILTGENVTDVREKLMNRLGSSKLRAVQENRVYVLYTDTAASPRAVVGMLYIAKALYPERFADIDPEQVLHEYAAEFLPGSDPPDAFCPSLSGTSISS
jgi:iron complex transport system substrate-binding protein